MLFFKQIKDEKFRDPAFKSFYTKECHICALTIRVISLMEDRPDRAAVLDLLNISESAYEQLKSGDCCHPDQVMGLARYLGIQNLGEVRNCPGRADVHQ